MSRVRWQTHAQHVADIARRREGRPDKAAMSREQRREAGLMGLGQAAEIERIRATTVLYEDKGERVRGPDPSDIWASKGGDDAA
jgi:hypothetical protein